MPTNTSKVHRSGARLFIHAYSRAHLFHHRICEQCIASEAYDCIGSWKRKDFRAGVPRASETQTTVSRYDELAITGKLSNPCESEGHRCEPNRVVTLIFGRST